MSGPYRDDTETRLAALEKRVAARERSGPMPAFMLGLIAAAAGIALAQSLVSCVVRHRSEPPHVAAAVPPPRPPPETPWQRKRGQCQRACEAANLRIGALSYQPSKTLCRTYQGATFVCGEGSYQCTCANGRQGTFVPGPEL